MSQLGPSALHCSESSFQHISGKGRPPERFWCKTVKQGDQQSLFAQDWGEGFLDMRLSLLKPGQVNRDNWSPYRRVDMKQQLAPLCTYLLAHLDGSG